MKKSMLFKKRNFYTFGDGIGRCFWKCSICDKISETVNHGLYYMGTYSVWMDGLLSKIGWIKKDKWIKKYFIFGHKENRPVYYCRECKGEVNA